MLILSNKYLHAYFIQSSHLFQLKDKTKGFLSLGILSNVELRQYFLNLQKRWVWGWRPGSGVACSWHSCRRTRFGSEHPCSNTRPSLISVPVVLTLSSGLHRHNTHVVHTQVNTHRHKMKTDLVVPWPWWNKFEKSILFFFSKLWTRLIV